MPLNQQSIDRRTADLERIGLLTHPPTPLTVNTYIIRRPHTHLSSGVSIKTWTDQTAELADGETGFMFYDDFQDLFTQASKAKWALVDHGYDVIDDGLFWLVQLRQPSHRSTWDWNAKTSLLLGYDPTSFISSTSKLDDDPRWHNWLLERDRLMSEDYLHVYGQPFRPSSRRQSGMSAEEEAEFRASIFARVHAHDLT